MASPSVCPNCSAPVVGRYCAECGVPLAGATCASCRTPLTPGAKFCHDCGAPAGGAAKSQRTLGVMVPWAVAGIALLAFIAREAGQRFASTAPDVAEGAAPAMAAAPRAPDISQMTPRDRATRLYDRTMQARERGKTDSAAFFATMATMAYAQIPDLDADGRFEAGRVALIAAQPDLGKAQADTILSKHPNHLLGLILLEESALIGGNKAAAKSAHDKLVAAAKTEQDKPLPEYKAHAGDIAAALSRASTPQTSP